MIRIISTILLALTLASCASFQANLTKANNFANLYFPVIGKDLIMIANILVQAECSPGLASGSQVAGNVLSIIAPNSSSIVTVRNVLNTNVQVAQQLCPLLLSIKINSGAVPNGTPTQVIPAP